MNRRSLKSQASRLDNVLDKLIVEGVTAKQEACVDELKRHRIIDRALVEAELEPGNRRAPLRKHLFRAAIAVAASAVLAVVWFLLAYEGAPSTRPDVASRAVASTMARDAMVPSAKETDSSYVHMDFAPGIKAVITQDTQFTIDRTLLTKITVRISQGAAWVTKAPKTKQTSLEIETPKGTVIVTGTVFSVHVDERTLRVSVLKGTVRVVETVGVVHSVAAGFSVTVDDNGVAKIPISDMAATQAAFIQLGILDIGDVRGRSSVRAPQAKTASRGHRSQVSEPAELRVTAKDLLSQIKLLRQQKDWAQMSITYRRLIRNFRHSPQAGLAMVSLGNLLTDKLDDPEEAIHWFNVYLKNRRGSLVPEALFGKAKALRRLGKRRAELTVLKEIVKRYPNSLYASRAADWIADRENR